MTHVPLVPIGSARAQFTDEATFTRHLQALGQREATLRERRVEVAAGWGDKYVGRVHDKGKLTARERLARLADPGTEPYEVGTFVNYGVEFGDRGLTSPGAGVVTAFTKIEGRWCMVIANDNTVASGSWWPMTPEKIERAQTMALRLRLPTVYLVDCSGLFLPEQSRSFPGATGAGHIFKMNSLLSAHGVPQIAGCVRRLHRRRRLHADHQRPRLHDRAGVHGDRRRGADQRREEPEDHQPRHRRAGGPRARQSLRRRPGARRRHAAVGVAPRGDPVAVFGRRLLPGRRRRGGSSVSGVGADRALARGSPRGLRRHRGARAAVRRQPVLGGDARVRRGDDLRDRSARGAVRRVRDQPTGAGRQPGASRASGALRRSSTAPASRRSPPSPAPATTTASRCSGCRTSPVSTSATRRRRRACSRTAATSSTPTPPTTCRCSPCCCARHRARATTRWRACRMTPSSSCRPRSRACR